MGCLRRDLTRIVVFKNVAAVQIDGVVVEASDAVTDENVIGKTTGNPAIFTESITRFLSDSYIKWISPQTIPSRTADGNLCNSVESDGLNCYNKSRHCCGESLLSV